MINECIIVTYSFLSGFGGSIVNNFLLTKCPVNKLPVIPSTAESIFSSRVEGRGFHVEGEGSMSRVEGDKINK